MDLLTGIFSAFGLSASAGLNAYIPLLAIGVIDHYTDLLTLQKPWDTLSNPWILILLGFLLIIEMLADKIPAVNHVNDAIQSFVRPAAGAVAFAASSDVITGVNPVLALALGLFVAGGVNVAKSVVVRPAVTAATGGVANTPVSIAEDVAATGVSILAILLPVAFATLFIVFAALLIWWLWRRANRDDTAGTPSA